VRQGRKPGVAAGGVPSQGSGAKPPEAESYSVVGYPKEMENLLQFSYFTTYSLFSKNVSAKATVVKTTLNVDTCNLGTKQNRLQWYGHVFTVEKRRHRLSKEMYGV